MTKELEVIQRKHLQEAVSIAPAPNTFGAVQGALGAVSQVLVKAATASATEAAAQQGGAFALENQGKPKKLAPGLTAATKAYNNSYNNVTTNLISLDGQALINENLRTESQPGRLNSTSLTRFSDLTKSTIKGVLSTTPDHLKADVSLKLMASAASAGEKLANKVSAFNNAEMNAKFDSLMNNSLRDMRESFMAGDEVSANIARNTVAETIKDKKNLGLMTPEQEEDALRVLRGAEVSSDYLSRYLRARADGTDDQMLSDFGKTKPKGITHEEWLSTGSQMLSLKKSQDALVSGQQRLNASKWKSMVDSGEVQDITQLEEARGEVSSLEFASLTSQLKNNQIKAFKTQQQVDQFNLDNQTNTVQAARAPAEVKDSSYKSTLEAKLAQKKFETQDEGAQLTLTDKAEAVSSYNTTIPLFNEEINAALTKGSLVDAPDTLSAYKTLIGDPDTVDDDSKAFSLDKQAQQVASSALRNVLIGHMQPEEALEQARNSVLNVTSQDREARKIRFDQTYSMSAGKAGKDLRKLFKSDTGTNSNDNAEMFNDYHSMLSQNAVGMGDFDEAEALTKRQINSTWKKTKFGGDSNEKVRNPIESTVPMSDVGQWMPNQILYATQSLANNHQRAADLKAELPAMSKRLGEVTNELVNGQVDAARAAELNVELGSLRRNIGAATFVSPVTVRWGHDRNLLKNPTEEQLMTMKLKDTLGLKSLVGDAKIEIGGEMRKVFLKPDMNTMTRNDGRPTYGFYYRNNQGFDERVPDPFNYQNQYGAEFAAASIETFLGGKAAALSDQRITDLSKELAGSLFDEGDPVDTEFGSRFGFYTNPFGKGTSSQIAKDIVEKSERKKAFVKEKAPGIAEKFQEKQGKKPKKGSK